MITVNAQFTVMRPVPLITQDRLSYPVIFYLASIVTPIRFMAGPMQMTSLRLYMIAMIVPIALQAIRSDRVRLCMTDLFLVLFVVWVGVAMAVNTPAQAIEHTGITMLELLGGYFLARVYIQTSEQFISLIKAISLIVFLCLPLAVFETMTGRPPLIELFHSTPGLSSVEVVDIAPRLGLERVQAVFAHPIHFGLFCSITVSLYAIGLRQHLSRTRRIIGLGLIILTAFLALSSGAFISVLIQLMLILWSLCFFQSPRKWLFLVLALTAAYLYIDMLSDRTPLRVFMSYATFSAHNAYWRSLIFEWGLVNVLANPVFGLGLKDWVRPHFMYSGSMDNFWLANAVHYGLPGIALLGAAWLSGLIKVACCNTSATNQRMAWVFCMIGLSFTLATVHVWTAVYSFVFFLFGAGQWMAVQAPKTQPISNNLPFRRPLKNPFQRLARQI